jgi:deazaflavin-dependent oxidoreductase (nitroreductase family)
MGFDAPAGTRGARQPRAGLMMRWMNKMAARRIRRTGKMTGLGFNALILTTVGAKSGAERTTPVGWFPGPDGSWLIVASAAGAARNPAWYHNIAAHPGHVKIELSGRTIPVTAAQLHGPPGGEWAGDPLSSHNDLPDAARAAMPTSRSPRRSAAMRALSESRVGYAPCAGTPVRG